MYNEIGRKLTSVTLMAIMVAGGMTIAAPGFAPAEAQVSNPNLIVSADNPNYENYFGGPQVIEVVINDPDIDDTDEGKGEPDVTVNGKDLRMVQATDGNWYGYFADKGQAEAADATVDIDGKGLDFGNIISPPTRPVDFTDTNAIAHNYLLPNGDEALNVVRQPKDVNTNSPQDGQIGVDTDMWPIIQLYNFNPTGNVVVQYNKAGGAQSVTLTFDTVDGYAGAELDRNVYPQGAQLHATITDTWLNIDPTDEDSWTFSTAGDGQTHYQVFDENGAVDRTTVTNTLTDALGDLMCDDNCVLLIDTDAQGTGDVIMFQDNNDSKVMQNPSLDASIMNPVTITEQGPNSGVFGTYDEADKSVLTISGDAKRNTSATFDYNDTGTSVLVGFDFATIDIQPVDDVWSSGETIGLVIMDADGNKNSRVDEDMILSDPGTDLIPALQTGDPFTLGDGDPMVYLAVTNPGASNATNIVGTEVEVQSFSDRAIVMASSGTMINSLLIDLGTDAGTLNSTLLDTMDDTVNGFNFYNQDVQSFGDMSYDVYLLRNSGGSIVDGGALNTGTDFIMIASGVGAQSGLVGISDETSSFIAGLPSSDNIGLAIVADGTVDLELPASMPIVADIFSYGFLNKGELGGERVANQIIRIEVEESGDNTNEFEGELEYVMINQLNILDQGTYAGLSPIASDPTFVVMEDFTDEDSIRVNYLDLGSDGVSTQIADQQEAPTNSGIVSLDNDNYKVADTVTITLEDADLNVDSDLIEIYTIEADDTVGMTATYDLPLNTGPLGRVLDVTFDDATWMSPANGMCEGMPFEGDTGLDATGFTLVETDTASGVFMGDFQIPAYWCQDDMIKTTTGLDIEVNYVDFRDASGEIIEVGDSAGVRANTGSVSLDRTVYPVPFGTPSDFDTNLSTSPDGRSLFPVHQTGMDDMTGLQTGEFINSGDLTIHVRINDPDFDISAAGEDVIAMNTEEGVGPVKVSVIRGASTVVLGYAGGESAMDGVIGVGDNLSIAEMQSVTQFGPITEIAPDAGIFEADIGIKFSDGPASTKCPAHNMTDRFMTAADSGNNYCILQGDILQVEYKDPTDASGDMNTVTDSATFDLRNGVLQSDKSVYLIGSDIILTLIEPDFDLDNDQAETYDLDLIEWDSDAATVSMGSDAAFDPEPSDFRETGDSTGIFQIVIETPGELAGDRLERGEQIDLEYTDWGPSGSDFVGDEDEDVGLTVYTSNFGATVELDQKVYSWTDKVFITIVAPDHNFDSDLVDEIGETDSDPIKVSTRGADLDNYKLVETGTNTGIFTGEVILTGFAHNADGDTTTGTDGNDVLDRAPMGSGPTDGFLPADDDDGITVSFEFSEDETIVGSALIRWNIGEVQWLEASYPATGTGVVRVVDADMNLDPEAVDNFEIDVWSDSDSGGIDLTVTETNEATGIFEGTVFFTVSDESSGHRLRIAENDTVTAEYEDNTLPDPYTTADELDVSATTLIGTLVPPLERAPASNLRIVDALKNSLETVSVDQQVQVVADLTNGQDSEQQFAYLVQIQDGNGVTVSLSWIEGSLSAGQSLSPSQSWTPTDAGDYTATAFVWESIDNPTALSPPITATITVS